MVIDPGYEYLQATSKTSPYVILNVYKFSSQPLLPPRLQSLMTRYSGVLPALRDCTKR